MPLLYTAPRSGAPSERNSPGDARELLERLSPRLLEVWAQLVEDKSNKEIAAFLNISVNTVKSYIRKLYAVLGVHKRSGTIKVWHDLMNRD